MTIFSFGKKSLKFRQMNRFFVFLTIYVTGKNLVKLTIFSYELLHFDGFLWLLPINDFLSRKKSNKNESNRNSPNTMINIWNYHLTILTDFYDFFWNFSIFLNVCTARQSFFSSKKITSIPFGSAKGVMADFGSRHDFQSI